MRCLLHDLMWCGLQISQMMEALTKAEFEKKSLQTKVGVVWCGVVWCGVVWSGVVWSGVEWCGVVWCGVEWCGVVWCSVWCTLDPPPAVLRAS